MRPILLTKESSRQGSIKDKPFNYDYCYDMNMRDGIPFIKNGSLREKELMTKTRQIRERDDECNDHLIEFIKNTNQKKESDDDNFFTLSHELSTETGVDREKYDEDQMLLESETITKVDREGMDIESSFLLELYSKTFQDRERDDVDDTYYY